MEFGVDPKSLHSDSLDHASLAQSSFSLRLDSPSRSDVEEKTMDNRLACLNCQNSKNHESLSEAEILEMRMLKN